MKEDIRIIDDTYNANPASMRAAVSTLARVKGEGRGIAILGDMRELGESAAALHRELGAYCAGTDVERLYASGDFADAVAEGARSAGMAADRIMTGGKEDILKDILNQVRPHDCILVKGSRGMKMETVVNGLKQILSE
jgi:UDP-N-acetylmuramoyl-tripeptide--D-alanyl-D-alanine ligase